MVGPVDVFYYGVVRFTEAFALAMPPRVAVRCADLLGTVWWLFDRRRRKRASENLRVAFGQRLSPTERRRTIRRVFCNMARVPLEGLWARRVASTWAAFRRCVTFHGDRDAFLRHIESGAPALLLLGHLGSWEILGQGLRRHPLRLHFVVRPVRERLLNRHMEALRGGSEMLIQREGAPRGSLRALRAGDWVGMVADQNAGRRGEFVPFFGLRASTYAAPVRIAVRADVPLFMAACLRRPGAPFRFDVHVRRIRLPTRDVSTPAAVTAGVAETMATLESWIRLAPDQYNWLHRRWKDRPPGEAPGAHLPRYDHHRPRKPVADG